MPFAGVFPYRGCLPEPWAPLFFPDTTLTAPCVYKIFFHHNRCIALTAGLFPFYVAICRRMYCPNRGSFSLFFVAICRRIYCPNRGSFSLMTEKRLPYTVDLMLYPTSLTQFVSFPSLFAPTCFWLAAHSLLLTLALCILCRSKRC